MKVFVTGGTGFIGSHTCVELLNAGFEVVVYDNLCNSSPSVLQKIEQITHKQVIFHEGDIRDESRLTHTLKGCDAVIHFAGLKAVGESVAKPLEYYDNNIHGTLCLLQSMQKVGIKKFIFSSSATVYGNPEFLPFTEDHPLRTNSPYAYSKLVIEDILRTLFTSDREWSIAILRYFNPVGAHESGLIGENPQGMPNNLMPYIAQTGLGIHEYVKVFGNDYETKDGTGVRDYLHVVDLAWGHVKALAILNEPRCEAINLGTGTGYSVLDVIHTFSLVCGRNIPYKIMPRRAGDIAGYYADPTKAKHLLKWEAKYDLAKMCEDMWRFQCKKAEQRS